MIFGALFVYEQSEGTVIEDERNYFISSAVVDQLFAGSLIQRIQQWMEKVKKLGRISYIGRSNYGLH